MVAAGVPGAAFSRDPSAVAFGRVERLTDRVWLVVERDDDAPVFLYVVVGASRVLLVDSGAGGEPYGDWLDGFLMGAAGLDAAARPRTCVNLDGGLRHVGGNGSLGAATTIAASGRDRAFTAAARDAARREARRRGRRDLEPYDVGAWLDDGASLDLGGGDAVRVVQTPGHAPDALCPGQDKRAKFPTSKAHISAIFHSFRLIFGRAIISRIGLEAWMLFPERARAEH